MGCGTCLILWGTSVECGSSKPEVGEGETEEEVGDEGESEEEMDHFDAEDMDSENYWVKVDETDSSYARAEVSQTKPSIGSRSGGGEGGSYYVFW